MATVPIEIIVQDYVPEETPGEDTPGTITPEDTETTEELSVPDTGLFSNNPTAATIITSSSILLFVIATIITLFAIKKQHKAKKQAIKVSKASKAINVNEANKETKTSTIIATSTLSIITITALLTELILSSIVQPTLSSAIDEGTTIETPDKITIEVTRTEDEDTFLATTKTTNTITSDSQYGYELSLSMNNSNLCLETEEDNAEPICITPTETPELGINTWGYTTDNIEEAETITYHNFSEPLVIESEEPTEGTTVDIYYAINIDKELPAGTYTSDENGGIEYTIEAKEDPNAFPGGLVYMQDFATLTSEEKATIIDSMTEGKQYQLKDNRDPINDGADYKTYYVAKLADGKVWMTQNLDHDIRSDFDYNSTNTDIPSAPSEPFDATWKSSYTKPAYGDPGDNCWSGAPDDDTLVSCTQNGNHYHLGNYYNWTAAIAMTDSTYDSDNVDQSICPAGWTLPRGDEVAAATNDFVNLLSQPEYGWSSSTNTLGNNKTMWGEPLYFALGGSWDGSLDSVGSDGYYWSSTVGNSKSAYFLLFDSGGTVAPDHRYARKSGFPIRCVAR